MVEVEVLPEVVYIVVAGAALVAILSLVRWLAVVFGGNQTMVDHAAVMLVSFGSVALAVIILALIFRVIKERGEVY